MYTYLPTYLAVGPHRSDRPSGRVDLKLLHARYIGPEYEGALVLQTLRYIQRGEPLRAERCDRVGHPVVHDHRLVAFHHDGLIRSGVLRSTKGNHVLSDQCTGPRTEEQHTSRSETIVHCNKLLQM